MQIKVIDPYASECSLAHSWHLVAGTFFIVGRLSLSLLRLRCLILPQVLSGQGRLLVENSLLGLSHWAKGVSSGSCSIVGVLEPHDHRKRDGLVLTISRAHRWNCDTGNDWLRGVRWAAAWGEVRGHWDTSVPRERAVRWWKWTGNSILMTEKETVRIRGCILFNIIFLSQLHCSIIIMLLFYTIWNMCYLYICISRQILW